MKKPPLGDAITRIPGPERQRFGGKKSNPKGNPHCGRRAAWRWIVPGGNRRGGKERGLTVRTDAPL